MKTDYAKIQSFMNKHAVHKTEDELKKESQALFEKRKEEEDRLLKLYEDNKLTNKATIAKAKSIKARRAAAKKSDK